MMHRATQWFLHAASRIKRAVHRATAPRSTPAQPSDDARRADDADRLMQMLFPDGSTDSQIRHTLDVPNPNATTVRRALGQANQHSTPTPFSVRLSPSDVAYVAVGGIEVALDTADQSVSSNIIEAGEWEPQVVHVLRKYLQPGSVFVDIGANVGWHTAVGSSIVGPTGRVYAIEPNPDNARLIAHTIQRNGLANVELLPFALSERTGFAAFRSAIGSNGGFAWGLDPSFIDPAVTIVPTMRFDELDIARVDVIKMDVEGAEPMVMRGAVAMIERDHPVIVFEFSCEMTQRVGGVEPREHLRFFEDHGYTLSIIDRSDGSLIPVTDVDALLSEWTDPFRIEDFVAAP
jgi:FkbM family methyltransferase